MDISFTLISIGCIICIVAIILFIKGIGNDGTHKVKFLSAEIESKAPSLIIFVIGAILIYEGATLKTLPEKAPVVKSLQARMDSLGSTGWIFLGYYDLKIKKYTEEPPNYTVYKSSYNPIPDSLNLNKGDILLLQKERNVIIQDEVMNPPLKNLAATDYTGVKLPIGTRVKVEDFNLSSFPGSPEAVWARIRLE